MEETKQDESTMNAIYLSEKGENKFEYGQVPKPTLGKNQVLIKVESVPLNPSDLYCLEGKYSNFMDFEYPFVPGWEGSGTVIETGGGIHAWYLKGKRVSFSKANEEMTEGAQIKIGGTMAQYAVTNAYQCVPIDDEVSFNEAASFFVNPLTAIGLTELVTDDKGTSVVITAAASQLGKMMIRLFHENGVEVIATARKQDQVDDLKNNFNVEHVINTSSEDYVSEFKELVKSKDTKHLLECIGGEVFGRLMSVMPKKSTAVLYGNLSRSDVGSIDPFALIGNQITCRGWLLNQWIEGKNLVSLLFNIRKVRKMLRENLSTTVQKEFDIADIKEAKQYYEDNMSKGKIILKPWGVES